MPGLNIQHQCRNVHHSTPTTSKAVRNEAIHRPCRLGQRRFVLAYEYIVDDSSNAYLQNRSMNKAMAGLIIEMTPLITGSDADETEDKGSCDNTDLAR